MTAKSKDNGEKAIVDLCINCESPEYCIDCYLQQNPGIMVLDIAFDNDTEEQRDIISDIEEQDPEEDVPFSKIATNISKKTLDEQKIILNRNDLYFRGRRFEVKFIREVKKIRGGFLVGTFEGFEFHLKQIGNRYTLRRISRTKEQEFANKKRRYVEEEIPNKRKLIGRLPATLLSTLDW